MIVDLPPKPSVSGHTLDTIEKLGSKHVEAQSWHEAIKFYEALCVVAFVSLGGPQPIRLSLLGSWLNGLSVCLFELKEAKQASIVLDKAFEYLQSDNDSYLLAAAFETRVRYGDCKSEKEKAILEASADALYYAQKYHAASTLYMKLADAEDKNEARESRSCARVAICLHRLKDSSSAWLWANRALCGIGARISENWNIRAMCYDAMGDIENALSDYAQGINIALRSGVRGAGAALFWNRAQVYERMYEYPHALEDYRRACELYQLIEAESDVQYCLDAIERCRAAS